MGPVQDEPVLLTADLSLHPQFIQLLSFKAHTIAIFWLGFVLEIQKSAYSTPSDQITLRKFLSSWPVHHPFSVTFNLKIILAFTL